MSQANGAACSRAEDAGLRPGAAPVGVPASHFGTAKPTAVLAKKPRRVTTALLIGVPMDTQ